VINAAYRIDSAFQQTITGLCPNTYYEISCWMRNICSKCGCDSNGKGATNSSGPPFYIPSGAGDSSGVAPNLTFEIDGIDYYTTGNLLYNGQWVKKGFTFLTGPVQSSFTLKYFNNAPGGGGNDWALDDISVSTCSPNMKYSPSLNPVVCDSNVITIYDTVRCFFNNYVYYKWQRSTNAGASWSDVTGALGPASPVWNGSAWEYISSYTIPISQTKMINNGDKYRLVVATTLANLSDANCSFTDVGNIITLQVINCGIPLHTQLISFTGKMVAKHVTLNWTTTSENELLFFDVEKSVNGSDFISVNTIDGKNDLIENNYEFTDPMAYNGKTFYRIRMRNDLNKSVYSRIVQFSPDGNVLSFINVINPFSDHLQFTINAPSKSLATADLIDGTGVAVMKYKWDVLPGVTALNFPNTGSLPPGLYYLRINVSGMILQQSVLKENK
jgi:hypothetical protein